MAISFGRLGNGWTGQESSGELAKVQHVPYRRALKHERKTSNQKLTDYGTLGTNSALPKRSHTLRLSNSFDRTTTHRQR